MNKKGIIFKKLLQIILIIIIISIFASTVLNKNFYYDTLDFIENLFEPPEVDPLPSSTKILIEREKGFKYLQEWADLMDEVKLSTQPYCYKIMNVTKKESREEEIAIVFTTTNKDSFNIKLQQKGGTLSVPIEINAPLCIIGEIRDSAFSSATDLISNFDDAFIKNKKQEKDECLKDPTKCVLMISQIKTMSNEYASYDSFSSEFQINSEEIKSRRTSFAFNYYVSDSQGNTEEVFKFSSGKLSDAGYLLFKIQENICIMPLAQTNILNIINGRGSRKTGDLNILKRSKLFTRNYDKKDALKRIPECEVNEVVTETVAKQELLQIINNAQDVKFQVTFNDDPNNQQQENNLEFEYKTNQWTINKEHPNPQVNTNYINVTDEDVINETAQHNILPLHDELKNIIITLRAKTKENGNEYILNYENDELIKIEINNQMKEELIRIIRFKGPEIIKQEFE